MSDVCHDVIMNRNMDDWDIIVQPVIERLFRFIEDYIGGIENDHTEFFSLTDAVDVYTAFYNFTSDKRFEHIDLTSLYQKEMWTFQEFIRDRFEMRSMEGILRHYRAFRMMEKWFMCFFHHLNRSYTQIIGHDAPTGQAFTSIFVRDFLTHNMNIMNNIFSNAWKTDRYSDKTRDALCVVLAVNPEWESMLFGMFCDVSRNYFREEKTRLAGGDRVLYMDIAMMMLERERARVKECFPAGRWGEVYTIFREEVIDPVYLEFIDSDDAGWKRHPSMVDAFQFYRHGDHKILLDRYTDSIRSSVPLHTANIVGWIVGFYSEQKRMILHGFTQEDTGLIAEFRRALSTSITRIFESHPTMIHHLISKFDRAMRRNDDVLPYVSIFEYISNKDALNEQYKKALSARILESGASLRDELRVLSVMRETMGNGYIMSMMNMITDVRDKTYHDGNLCVSILSRMDWVIDSARTNVWIPPDIRARIEAIERVYIGDKTSVKLEMSPLFGQVILIGTYEMRRYDMLMSPLQATAILLLSGKDGVSGDYMVRHFGGDSDLSERVMHSLTREKFALVESDKDNWRLSPVFVSSMRRIRLPAVLSSIKESNGRVDSSPMVDPNAIDAAIIRIMKARRSIHHTELVVATGNVTRCLDIKSIKYRISSLIDRDYISRDPSHNFLYHYIP